MHVGWAKNPHYTSGSKGLGFSRDLSTALTYEIILFLEQAGTEPATTTRF